MISNLIADASGIVMIVVLLVLFVGMMLISIIPQKKKQKEYEAMQNAIKVGTRIMTIGRLIGTVTAVNADNTLEVDIGVNGNPVVILINREGVGINLDAQQVAADGTAENKADATSGDVDADDSDVAPVAPVAEPAAEEQPQAQPEQAEEAPKKGRKGKKKNMANVELKKSNDDDAI